MADSKPRFITPEAVMPLVASVVMSGAIGLVFSVWWVGLLVIATLFALADSRLKNRVVAVCFVGAWLGAVLSLVTAVILQLLK